MSRFSRRVALLGLLVCVLPSAPALASPAWLAPQDVSAIGANPHVAVDGQGNAVATWSRNNPNVVQAATRPAGGAWGAPQDLGDASINASPQVALDSQGNAVAIWRYNNIVQTATRPAGGAWGITDGWGGGQTTETPQVALDSQGNAVATWHRYEPTGPMSYSSFVQAATRPAGGAWGAAQSIGGAGQTASPQVALDSQGTAVVTWEGFDGTNYIVQAATRPAGGAWGAPQDLSAAGQDAETPQVALDSQGNAVATWQRSGVQAATRPAGGAWGAPQDLSAAGGVGPQVALDSQGNAVVAWQKMGPGAPSVQAAGYDAAGPQLRSLQIPGAGSTGSPLGFSVQPVDVWSPVASTAWSFGDGGVAPGTDVSHTYMAPGSYTAGVTATDSLGNSTTKSGQLAISPGSIPPPGGSGSGGDKTAPKVTLALSKQKLPPALRKGLKGTVGSSEAAKVTLTALLDPRAARRLKLSRTRKPVVVAKATVSFSAAGKKSVKLRFTAKAKRALRKLRKVTLSLQGTGRDLAGNVSPPVKRKLTLRR